MKKIYFAYLEKNGEIIDNATFYDVDDMIHYLNKILPYETSDARISVDEVNRETYEVVSQDIYTWEDTLYGENIYTATVQLYE